MSPSRPLLAARSLAALVFLSAGFLLGPLAAPAAAVSAGTYEKDVIGYTNAERTKRDLAKVKAASCLDGYAERHAKAMATKKRLYHQDLSPILAKCRLSAVGENVAYGYPSGKAVTAAWMKSPGHRKNLLNSRYRLVGVGAYQDSKGRWYVAQVLGRAR